MLPIQENGFKIPINQQVTDSVMTDQPVVESKIHIQALHHPDPDFFDDSDEIKNIAELVEYYLTFQCKNFGDLYSDFQGDTVLLSKMHSIMFDSKDDELGRIRQELNKVISEMAYFVHSNYETNRWAKNIYEETLASVV
jgi:hypothetical protein